MCDSRVDGVEPLIHFVVPFAALMLGGVTVGKAFPIALFALVPDLDTLFRVHRSPSHSMAILLCVAVPLLLLTYRFRPRLHGYTLLGSLSVASHLVLDLFDGYAPILWPLYNRSVWVKTEFLVHFGGSVSMAPSIELLTAPVTFEPFGSLDASLITGGGLIFSAVLLTPFFLQVFRTLWQRTGLAWRSRLE